MYQTTTKVKIEKEIYEVKYPNVGEQLQIESVKELLSNGKYAQLAATGSKTATQLLDFIDAVSYFTVLIPAIKEKIDLKNFTGADPMFQKRLSKAFFKYYFEFIIPVEIEINKEVELEEKEDA